MPTPTRAELELTVAQQALRIVALEKIEPEQANARREIEVLKRRAEAADASYLNAKKETEAAASKMLAAYAARDTALKEFADLKDRLYAAERENARLQGYLERVYEDDVAREGFLEVPAGAPEMRLQPRRPAPLRAVNEPSAAAATQALGYADRADCRHPRPRHWVNYGR